MTLPPLRAVVMTRAPSPGRIKTRLQSGFPPATVLEIAWAMLGCTLERLAEWCAVTLAVTPDGQAPRVAAHLRMDHLRCLDQGPGELGERLDRVWRTTSDGPVAFFGMDTPDLPDEHLAAIPRALGSADAAVGPTSDGGYWTLAARRYAPELLRGIDWGTGRVYDQTMKLAARAGIAILPLPEWPDVDEVADVEALMRRLAARTALEPSDAPMRRLRERLDRLCGAGARRLPEP